MIEIDHETALRLNKGGEENPYEAETLQSVTLSKHVDVLGFSKNKKLKKTTTTE